MNMHASLTQEVLEEAIEQDSQNLGSTGFCTSCGAEHTQVEPDAENYECSECGAMEVYGAEGLLFHFL